MLIIEALSWSKQNNPRPGNIRHSRYQQLFNISFGQLLLLSDCTDLTISLESAHLFWNVPWQGRTMEREGEKPHLWFIMLYKPFRQAIFSHPRSVFDYELAEISNIRKAVSLFPHTKIQFYREKWQKKALTFWNWPMAHLSVCKTWLHYIPFWANECRCHEDEAVSMHIFYLVCIDKQCAGLNWVEINAYGGRNHCSIDSVDRLASIVTVGVRKKNSN